MRVLVVSQDANVRLRALGGLQARPDVDIVEATSAAQAHGIFAGDETIDVVIMDADMRPEGGYSVVYEMRADAQLRGVEVPPVILLMDRPPDRWLAQWAGARDAMLKPVNPFDLAERVVQVYDETAGRVRAETAGGTVGQELAMDEPPEIT